MNRRTTILVLLIALQTICDAQTDTLKKPRFMKFYAASVNAGVYAFTDYKLSRDELQTINPDNQLLKKDISNYHYEGNNREYSGFCMSANAGFILYNKKKQAYNKRQEFHFGTSYQINNALVHEYLLDERVPFDTLKSNTSTNVYYIDTTKTSRYSYSNSRKNILFNVSHTFHTKPNRIFSLYVGYSLCYGRVINNITTAEYLYSEGFEDQNHKTYDYTNRDQSSIGMDERSVTHKGNIFQAAIPIGGLIRLSKTKKNYLKRLALNVETRTGVQLTQIPGSSNITQAFFNINFGMKFFLNREAIK